MDRQSTIALSVVIPAYSRLLELDECLRALAASTLDSSLFEVIVVNDGGICPGELVRNYSGQLNVRLLSQSNQGAAAARNFGAQAARGTHLAFVDDDCMPTETWLEQIYTQTRSMPKALIGGRTVNKLTENLYSEASQILIDYLYATAADDSSLPFFAGNHIVCPTELFKSSGGFDSNFSIAAEDRDFCKRWSDSGKQFQFVSSAILHHGHHLDIRTFARQHFRYGRGAYMFHAKNASSQNRKQLQLPPIQYYLDLICFPLQHGRSRDVLLVLLLVLSQVFTAAGFLKQVLCSSAFQEGEAKASLEPSR